MLSYSINGCGYFLWVTLYIVYTQLKEYHSLIAIELYKKRFLVLDLAVSNINWSYGISLSLTPFFQVVSLFSYSEKTP